MTPSQLYRKPSVPPSLRQCSEAFLRNRASCAVVVARHGRKSYSAASRRGSRSRARQREDAGRDATKGEHRGPRGKRADG
jgi:hypothetical protein